MKYIVQATLAFALYLAINNIIINVGLLFFNTPAFPRLYISGYICGGEEIPPTVYIIRCVTMIVLRVFSFTIVIYYFWSKKIFLLFFVSFDILCAIAVSTNVSLLAAPFFCNYFYCVISYWLWGNYYLLMGFLGLIDVVIARIIISRKRKGATTNKATNKLVKPLS